MLWDFRYLRFLDWRVVTIIFSLMGISLLVISSQSLPPLTDQFTVTSVLIKQTEFFVIGFLFFLFFAAFDYNKIREWTWVLYAIMILALLGLFFTDSIQRVHRWYKVPILNIGLQPSEYAKLVVIIALSWFLERRSGYSENWGTVFLAGLIVGIPFLLILKQPDLGTALVLLPMTLVMFYYGNIHPLVIKIMTIGAFVSLLLVALTFLEIIPHEQLRPYALKVMREYQFERLNPQSHHQKAAATSIAVAGWTGSGWNQSTYSGEGWLPAPYTDSVFPAFTEEFGFLGAAFLLGLLYALVYCCFQVTAVAQDLFARLLSSGISVYFAIHVLVNVGMMCGFLPITGVPLLIVTSGGSSVFFAMIALGILQSIYCRRYRLSRGYN